MTEQPPVNTSSTVQSYIDSAVAAGQSVLGSLTGNNNTNQQTDKNNPSTSTSQSHSSHSSSKDDPEIAKLGPIAASSSGGIATDSPLRTEGSYNQTVGAAKEALGGLVGADGLKKEGQRQNAEGKGQEAEGQVRDYGQGLQDRVGGTVGGVLKGLVGDREGEAAERLRHDDGKTAQKSAERDILRSN